MTPIVTTAELRSAREEIGNFLKTAVRETMVQQSRAIESKASDIAGDVVSALDYALQRQLSDFLTGILAGSDFVGEEEFSAILPPFARPTWIVDPLDGTLNYASGLPLFSISICLVVGAEPVLALVYDIAADVVFDAIEGDGARVGGQAFSWDAGMAEIAPIAISSGFLALATSGAQPTLFDEMSQLFGPRYRILGTQALQLCWAAAGRLKANVSLEAKLWDDAAGYLICKEARAGYSLLGEEQLFPLNPDTPACLGKSLFSIAGTPALVDRLSNLINSRRSA